MDKPHSNRYNALARLSTIQWYTVSDDFQNCLNQQARRKRQPNGKGLNTHKQTAHTNRQHTQTDSTQLNQLSFKIKIDYVDQATKKSLKSQVRMPNPLSNCVHFKSQHYFILFGCRRVEVEAEVKDSGVWKNRRQKHRAPVRLQFSG